MRATTFSTEPMHMMPLRNCGDTLSMLKNQSRDFLPLRQAVASTLGLEFGLTFNPFSDDPKKVFPTADAISPVSINSSAIFLIDEPFQFKNRDEVEKFIADKPDVLNLYNNINVFIKNIFGNSKIVLSVFTDYEEEWSNLRVEIESQHEIEQLSALESRLFEIIEKDISFVAALDHVTISLG